MIKFKMKNMLCLFLWLNIFCGCSDNEVKLNHKIQSLLGMSEIDSFEFSSKSKFVYEFDGLENSTVININSKNGVGVLELYIMDNETWKKEKEFKISGKKTNVSYNNEVYQTPSRLQYIPSECENNNGVVAIKLFKR